MNTIAQARTPNLPSPRRAASWRGLNRHRGLLIAIGVWLLMMLFTIGSIGMTYYDVSNISASGATLAIAAIGQTLVILSGGFDLSAGATVSLVNVVVASQFSNPDVSPWTVLAVGVGVGALTGAFNGFFIAVMRMQPIVVTLSTMFILQGVTLLVMDKPGGTAPQSIVDFLVGDAIPDLLPKPILLIAVVLLLWAWLKVTRLGMAMYAIGSEYASAQAAGVSTRTVQLLLYIAAGACYGLAGVFISAQTGSGDPLIGAPMLLQMFTAVVLGGTVLGGGRGGPTGTLFGAYILMMVVNTLLVLNVSAYYATVAEGSILILAVLASSTNAASPLRSNLRQLKRWWTARARGLLLSQRPPSAPATMSHGAKSSAVADMPQPTFWSRHASTLRYTLPSFVGFGLVLLVTHAVLDTSLLHWSYYNSLIVLASFLVVLALGQGTVILTGGLDLSLPWTIGLCGILLAGMLKGSNLALVYALPLTLLLGAAIGLLNGAGIVALGISPIVMTLAVNGILQGLALVYSNGTPDGFSAPYLRSLMTDSTYGIAPVVLVVVLFVVLAVLVLGNTAFGRAVYAVGNGQRAAELAGVRVGRTIVLAYMLSGLCSAIAAVFLTGLSGQASLGMGDDYLLPSIAVVVIGGTLIVGGRGHYLGMLGGVLLITALQILLAGTTLPYASRSILFGVVVLAAVMGLREEQR